MARLFIGTLKRVTFEWFIKLPVGSIKTWVDLEKLFLARFLKTIPKFQCQLSLQPNRGKESLSKPSSRDFRAWHSVVQAAWPSLHWLRYVIIICKLPYSLKWEWRNVILGSTNKANRYRRLSPGTELKKKTANQDPTSQCDASQSHLLNREEGILW